MTADVKNQTKIGVKFLFTNFSQIRTPYSDIVRTLIFNMRPKRRYNYLNVTLQGIEPHLHQRKF